MQKIFLSLLVLSTLFAACKNDNKSSEEGEPDLHASAKQLDGHWIAMDFCARANQYRSVLQAMNNGHLPYAYAITFSESNPDSAICDNGLESWSLPVKYNVDTVELVGARDGKSVYLVFHSQSEKNMTMFDVTTGQAFMDNFIKSKAGTKTGNGAFNVAINHNVLGGLFTSKSKGVTGDVQFTPGGLIQGIKDYDRYKLCIAGDCFVTGDQMDVVTFYNSAQKDDGKMLGFKFDNDDNLNIYELINSNPDEKGAYTVGKVVYALERRQPAN